MKNHDVEKEPRKIASSSDDEDLEIHSTRNPQARNEADTGESLEESLLSEDETREVEDNNLQEEEIQLPLEEEGKEIEYQVDNPIEEENIVEQEEENLVRQEEGDEDEVYQDAQEENQQVEHEDEERSTSSEEEREEPNFIKPKAKDNLEFYDEQTNSWMKATITSACPKRYKNWYNIIREDGFKQSKIFSKDTLWRFTNQEKNAYFLWKFGHLVDEQGNLKEGEVETPLHLLNEEDKDEGIT